MTRCWVLEKGGDRCVLTTDHPGPHMVGYHTFTSIPGTEEMARLIGSHCDQLEHALRDKIADLTAENERLRADIVTAYKSRDEAVERANRPEFDDRRVSKVAYDAACGVRDDWQAEANRLYLDLSRLTHDAAAECGRLRAERDGLLAAAKRVVDHWLAAGADWTPRQDALRAACAACAPEVKP